MCHNIIVIVQHDLINSKVIMSHEIIRNDRTKLIEEYFS